MKTFVILLRGVMPYGKNKVPMSPLRDSLVAAGLTDVQTYIQSGNVIAVSSLEQFDLEKLIHDTIKEKFGGDIKVLARSVEEFCDVFEGNPFGNEEPSKVYFSILSSKPDPNLLKDFLSTDFSPDKVRIISDKIYTNYATKHSDSRYNNNYYERKLKITATTRNFNTMAKLVELASE